MAANNFKFTDEQQMKKFEKQTVFKTAEETRLGGSPKTSSGLDAHVLASLTYLLGFVSGFILLIVERENQFVRFHAIQSICVSIVFLTIFMLWGMLPVIGWFAGVFLTPAGLVLWIILMLNSFDGKYSKVFYIGDFAEKQIKV